MNILEDTKLNRYVWLGAVTDESFKIVLDVFPIETDLIVSLNRTFEASRIVARISNASEPTQGIDPSIYKRIRHFTITNLQPGTCYFVGVLSATHDNNSASGVAIIKVGSVKTFPPIGQSAEVVVALGSCQRKARDSSGLGEIAQWREAIHSTRPKTAFIMLHMGDLHYADIQRESPALYAHAAREVVTAPRARNLFRTTPVAYVWDDHDFGANNSDASSPSRRAALDSFCALVPRPNTAGSGINYAFTVAKVRFVLTDLRSEAQRAQQKAMSRAQLIFLLDELREWEKFDAVVWMSSRPWIEKEEWGSDRWGGFAAQRRTIANFIAERKIDNLILASGDAHMLAADDGTHSCYSSNPDAKGFPVLQAAPLANFGSVKGGPYSEGQHIKKIGISRQYGMLRITPPYKGGNKTVEIEFNGYSVSRKRFANPEELLRKKPVIQYTAERPFLAKRRVIR